MDNNPYGHHHYHHREQKQPDICQQALSTLPEITAIVDSDRCVICLENISEPALARPCGHKNFDYLCLVTWLQTKPKCPLCQAKVESVEYSRLDEVCKVDRISTNPQTTASEHSTRPRLPLYPPLDPNPGLRQRRHVYNHQLLSSHVGTNRLSGYREITPQRFCREEELCERARKWIRRELQVFDFLNTNERDPNTGRPTSPEFVLEYIVAFLKLVNIQDARGQSEALVQEYLGRDNARIFLHELKSFLRSPYSSLEEWDRQVQYNEYHAEPSEEEISNAEREYRDSNRRGAGTGPQFPRFNGRHNSNQQADRYSPYQTPRQGDRRYRPQR